jgi:hypothetical protein
MFGTGHMSTTARSEKVNETAKPGKEPASFCASQHRGYQSMFLCWPAGERNRSRTAISLRPDPAELAKKIPPTSFWFGGKLELWFGLRDHGGILARRPASVNRRASWISGRRNAIHQRTI